MGHVLDAEGEVQAPADVGVVELGQGALQQPHHARQGANAGVSLILDLRKGADQSTRQELHGGLPSTLCRPQPRDRSDDPVEDPSEVGAGRRFLLGEHRFPHAAELAQAQAQQSAQQVRLGAEVVIDHRDADVGRLGDVADRHRFQSVLAE